MGVGFVSALSRSVCIVARKSSASVGIGAWLRSAITGSRASCIAFAVMFLILVSCSLLHSIWRCGALPFARLSAFVQKGHASMARWAGGVDALIVKALVWSSRYLASHRIALVWETAVYSSRGLVMPLSGNVVLGL